MIMMSLEPRNGTLAVVASSRLMASSLDVSQDSTPPIRLQQRRQRRKKYMEGTVGTRVDKDVMAIWIGFEKPEGELNRWLNKLTRAAKVAGATPQCSSTMSCSGMAAAEEVDAERLKRHKPRDTHNPSIDCKSRSPRCASCQLCAVEL